MESYTICGAMAQSHFVSFFVSINMSWISMSNESLWKGMSSVWCHTWVPVESWMELRTCLQRLWVMAGLLQYSCAARERCFGPFRGESKLQLRGCWNRNWSEYLSHIYVSKVSISCWLDRVSNFNKGGMWP